MNMLKIKSFFVIALLILPGCSFTKQVVISGKTMGTTYHIKIVTRYFKDIDILKTDIEKRLKTINQSMSTYIRDSEISKFNDLKNSEENFYVSDDFFQVMLVAENIYLLTDGAWDGTIDPLVNLWGFGRSGMKTIVPDKDQINNILKKTGFHNIKISKKRFFVKKQPDISVDLASVAKGYAVDVIADIIRQHGITDFLVEIGGEVFAAGYRKDGGNWRVGINIPEKDSLIDSFYKVVSLKDKAMATSGDYRNFTEINGKSYSHVINPKTGYPVDNSVVSVSVIADSCTFADGLATGVMVMGHKKGLDLINSIHGVESMIIVRNRNQLFTNYYSDGFKAFFK